MLTPTEQLLINGHFEYLHHPDLPEDIRLLSADEPGCWAQMAVVVRRVRDGSCRTGDWDAPMSSSGADIGEIRHPIFPRHYRLYVHAERGSNELKLLLFAWKPDGEVGLSLQNEHIAEASRRLMSWE